MTLFVREVACVHFWILASIILLMMATVTFALADLNYQHIYPSHINLRWISSVVHPFVGQHQF